MAMVRILLRQYRGGTMKGGVMKRNLLCLLIVVGMFLSTCGNEPPEDYYKGTPEDSSAIQDLIDANPEFLVSEDLFDSTYLGITLPLLPLSDADRYFRVDSMITKQHVDSCALELVERRYGLEFWFAKDTTCTVFLWDTVTFNSLMHGDVRWDIYYFWPPGDTSLIFDRIDTIAEPFYDTLEAFGICQRHMFFERDETGEWEFKRITYGTWNFPEEAQDVPFILNVVLDPDGNLGPISDTIVWSSYDTLYPNHIMDRFRSIDSLLTYSVGDTLRVTVNLNVVQVAAESCLVFATLDGNRMRFGGTGTTVGNVVLEDDGLVNLWVEVVVAHPFYYHYPRKDYKATAWLIPIRITQ
jgi:hypothetical protein